MSANKKKTRFENVPTNANNMFANLTDANCQPNLQNNILHLLPDSTRKRSAFKIVNDHFEHVPMNTNNMLANFTDANGQQLCHSHILHLLHVST
jgi:hypothetical protein